MGFNISNFTDNDDVRILDEKGMFKVIEYIRDLSCTPSEAQLKYFMTQQGVRKKQLVIELDNDGAILQPGRMQWMLGNVSQTTGLKGVGDAVGKFFQGRVTGESTIKPEYKGNGIVVTEPTYNHLLLENLKDWDGSMVIQDGLFYACDNEIQLKTIARSNLSSAVAGGEGLFNLCLSGPGVVALECDVPKEELIYIDLFDDVLKVDGSYAIAWSTTLNFTVERSGKSLLGSAASGEGLVNVYKGTGKILLMPQV
jgi:uncharacterized protein (AIM24 family)